MMVICICHIRIETLSGCIHHHKRMSCSPTVTPKYPTEYSLPGQPSLTSATSLYLHRVSAYRESFTVKATFKKIPRSR